MSTQSKFKSLIIPTVVLPLLAACSGPAPAPFETEPVLATPPTPDLPTTPDFFPDPLPNCNPDVSVQSDGSSLIVTDPTILSHFSLERVLSQLIAGAPGSNLTPLELLQRFFDTENTTATGAFADGFHCDAADNPAFAHAPAKYCPRAEGALASNPNLLNINDPNGFIPIALVNRFDLTPDSLETCGEYRIVYAKKSGLQNPQDRVFLIFEGSVTNANQGTGVMACLPLAQAWASIEAQTDAEKTAKVLEDIYFTGIAPFSPVVHVDHYGRFSDSESPYTVSHGQIRLSQGMQAPWDMREFHLKVNPDTMALNLNPVPAKNNPIADLLDAADQSNAATNLRMQFVSASWELGVQNILDITMHISPQYNAGESSVTGLSSVAYAEHAASNAEFLAQLDDSINQMNLNAACPPGNPIVAEDLLHRASIQTCAGCHAPAQFLGADRSLGCGLTWPDSLGQVHIDEHGKLSPALTNLLLPRRAEVMTTFLQGCDAQAIWNNFVQGSLPIPD